MKRPETGIVHLGLGAFFRAFGCIYVADAMAASGGGWGITGACLRRPDTRDALRARNWAYASVSLAPDCEELRDITVLNDVLVAPEDPQALLDAMADPAIKIVSLTVTEKGYCHDPATGKLNENHPDVIHDLAHPLPVSALGYLVRALQMRRAAGRAPFTVLCCDNLPDNGTVLRALVLQLSVQIDPDLSDWIAQEGRFPCTMVDRITPATTPADIERISSVLGYEDAAPVLHEPFGQWVIEDDFVGGHRPDFATAGAEMVDSVTAHEHMKLRMLNGAHSALAYLGFLAGHDSIAAASADAVFGCYLRALWAEIMPTVQAPEGTSLPHYADALYARFTNTAIHHRTWQIAMDGSQKLPQRLLGTLSETLAAGREAPALTLAVAAWMRYASGTDEAGEAIDVRDPMVDRFQAITARASSAEQTVAEFLALREVFSEELAAQLHGPVSTAAARLWSQGARDTLQESFA